MTISLDRWKTAIERGDVKAVRSLFDRYPELADTVDAKIFAFDSSAIFCSRSNIEMVDLLLKHGADINAKTGWEAGGYSILEGVTPDVAQPLIKRGAIVDIWAAVGLDNMERVQELLEQDSSLITAPGGDGVHPLHYARNVKMVDYLVSIGADVNARCVDHGSTPLQYLIQDQDVVFRLLDHGAEPDIFVAAYLGVDSLVKKIVAADPECCNARLGAGEWTHLGKGDIYNWKIGHDMTPAEAARSQGHADVAALILQLASPSIQLADAIGRGDTKTADTIMAEHKDALGSLIAEDPTAMARAAWVNNLGAVELMLTLGFDPHQTGVHDSTPLDRAAFQGYAEIIELLLRHDPNPPLHKRNEFGGAPLGACLFGMNHGWDTGQAKDHTKSVRLLIEAGSAVSEQMLGIGNVETDKLIKERLVRC